MRLSRALRALLVLPVVALAACAGPFAENGQRGIGMARVDTNVIFGANQAAPPSPAAAPVAGPTALPEEPAVDQPGAQFFTPNSNGFGGFGPAASCPAAPDTAAPADIADTVVNGMPRPGAYPVRTTGKVNFSAAGSAPIPLPIPNPLGQRYVRRPTVIADPLPAPPGAEPGAEYTFETVEPLVYTTLPGGFADYHWQVKTSSSTPRDPEGGLVLKEIDVLKPDGTQAATYFRASATGIMFLPLPVSLGGTWNSVAVDTTTSDLAHGSTISVSGQALKRETIDACGVLVQGWHAHLAVTTTPAALGGTGSAQSATLDFIVATQYGALPVGEGYDGSWMTNSYAAATFRDGQLVPDALPARFK